MAAERFRFRNDTTAFLTTRIANIDARIAALESDIKTLRLRRAQAVAALTHQSAEPVARRIRF
jgi:hypothetical protein